MVEIDRAWIFENLKHSLQALAMPADVQPLLFPDYVEPADELALCFDDIFSAAIGNFPEDFSPDQLAQLKGIDSMLSEMSNDKNCWSILALQQDQRWQELRLLATSLLGLLNWPVTRPPYSLGGTYVPGGTK